MAQREVLIAPSPMVKVAWIRQGGNSMIYRRTVFALLLSSCLLFDVMWAQVDTGSVYGLVTDQSGALMVGAKVTLKNESTGITRTVTTASNGTYTFSDVRVGSYTVTVEKQGFKTYSERGVAVAVTQSTKIDVSLQVGDVTEIVEVQAAGMAAVETRDSALGSVIEAKRVVDMPLNGRNFIQLSYFSPGVTVNYRTITLKGSPTNIPGGVAVLPVVNGIRNTANATLIDGALNTDPVLNTAAIVPVPDAIEEFKIQTNLYSAEFGQGGGSVINIVTKSGGKELHGTAYYFGRNDVFDARNYFLAAKPKLQRHQFGGTVGGPLKVGKTFFFGTYEALRQNRGLLLNSVVPSLAFRGGNLSSIATPLRDPIGGCITGNVIKVSCMDPVAVGLISKLWPEPNTGVTGFQASPVQTVTRNQFLVKIDNTSGRHSLSGRYVFDDGLEKLPVASGSGSGGVTSTGSGVPGYPVTNPSRFQNLVFSDSFVISARSLNQFRFTYLRSAFGNNLLVLRDDPTKFGFTFPINEFSSLPAVNVGGFALTGPPAQKDFTKLNNIFLWHDSFSRETAAHSFRFGGEIRRSLVDVNTGNFTAGSFTFNGIVTGNAFADYLLGASASLLQVSGDAIRNFRSTSYALFFQDAFRLKKNFTLNYGLRWEVFGPFSDPTIHDIGHPRLSTFIQGQKSTYATDLPVGIVLAGFDPGVRPGIVATDLNNFAPRIGFAWDPFNNSKLSIRAGYGVFFDSSVLDGVINSTDGTSAIRPAASPQLPGPGTMADPFKGNSPFKPPVKFPIPTTTTLSPTIVDPNQRSAYVQQWNLTVQHELPLKMLLSVGYVGTKGTKLTGAINKAQACFAPCNGQTTNTAANLQARRPYPGISGLTTVVGAFNSNYNGLQAELKRSMSHGLALQAAYTFSKNIDVTSQANSFFAIEGQTNLQDNYNPNADRGLSAYDARHRFVVNSTYVLPFARTATGLVRQVAGGWQTSAIMTIQSGSPFTVFDSSGRSFSGSGADRPDLICNPNLSGSDRTINLWFKTSCFQQVPLGVRFGTASRNIVTADGVQQVDLSVQKTFPIKEARAVEFRTEFFNLFNHTNFTAPINNFASPAVGRVLATSVAERQIQFALKLRF
jgi:hypothetical protein